MCYWVVLAASVLAQAIPGARTNAHGSLDVQEVLTRWQAGADLIESYDLSLELTTKLLLENNSGKQRLLSEREAITLPPSHSRIYRKAGRRRGEFMRDEHGHYAPPIIWDGNLGYNFQPYSNSVIVSPSIVVFGAEEYDDYEATYRAFYGTVDRITLSKARRSRLLPREGRLFVVDVPATTSGDYYNAHWRVWLDPDRNFLPVKLVQWFANDGVEVHSLDMEVELWEPTAGVWAPAVSLIRIFWKDRKSPLHGKNTMICELKVLKVQSKYNANIPDSLFAVQIPNGMTVIDRARNAVYTQGSGDPDKYLAQLAEDEKSKLRALSAADRSPSTTVFIPATDNSRWVLVLTIAASAVLALATFYVLGHRHKRKEL